MSNMKKIGNDIWNWLNGPDEGDAMQMSYFQRTALQANANASNTSNAPQQQLYNAVRTNGIQSSKDKIDIVIDSPSRSRKRESKVPTHKNRNSRILNELSSSENDAASTSTTSGDNNKKGVAEEVSDKNDDEVGTGEDELEDYDFYSEEHLDKMFVVVKEIQEEYEKKRKAEEIRRQKSKRATKVPKALLNPEVQRQIKKQKTYKPYFVLTITVIQVLIMLFELIYNWIEMGSPFDFTTENFNVMIGPSTAVLIHLGARWVPCMRSGFENSEISCIPGVEPYRNVTYEGSVIDICQLSDMCGMNLQPKTVPNQWWRFITPIFLHAGVIHIIGNLLFQVRIGIQMEKDFGTARIFLIYMISGIAGFMFGADYTIQTPSVGCSGSLYGLMACLLLDLILNWKLLIKPVKELLKMLLVILFSLGIGLLPFIDNFAHVGGFISGIMSGLILLPSIKFGLKDRIIKRCVTIVAIPVLIGFMVYLIAGFYNSDRFTCKWCRYVNCLPINGWCDDIIT